MIQSPSSTQVELLNGSPKTTHLNTQRSVPRMIEWLEALGQTDVGRDRKRNENCFVIKQQQSVHLSSAAGQVRGLYILCDGMGGHADGDVVSSRMLV